MDVALLFAAIARGRGIFSFVRSFDTAVQCAIQSNSSNQETRPILQCDSSVSRLIGLVPVSIRHHVKSSTIIQRTRKGGN